MLLLFPAEHLGKGKAFLLAPELRAGAQFVDLIIKYMELIRVMLVYFRHYFIY